MQDVTGGVRDKRYGWSSAGSKENIKPRDLGKKIKNKLAKKIVIQCIFKMMATGFK